MMTAIVSFTCPYCGAGIGLLKQIGRRQKKTKKPLFFYRCPICHKEFDLQTRHCRHIIDDTLAMEAINRNFFENQFAGAVIEVKI